MCLVRGMYVVYYTLENRNTIQNKSLKNKFQQCSSVHYRCGIYSRSVLNSTAITFGANISVAQVHRDYASYVSTRNWSKSCISKFIDLSIFPWFLFTNRENVLLCI